MLGGCRGDFPLQGVTPDGDYEFTVMFDSEDVEYIDSGKVLGERNREQKTELAQARKTAKANKDWAAIRSRLENDRQEFTTADLNSWGYSKNVIMSSELFEIADREKLRRSKQSERCRIIPLNEGAKIGVGTMGKIGLAYRRRNWRAASYIYQVGIKCTEIREKGHNIPLPKSKTFQIKS